MSKNYKSIEVMYNTKTATINNEEFVSSYMPVGINENVILKEVNVKKSPTNKDFIEFVFANDKDQTVKMSEWKNEKNMWIKTDEELQQRDDQQFGRILQIISCYLPEIPEAQIDSFSGMINWVKTQLDNIAEKEKQPLRLKAIYDKKGYVTVSTYGTFVEPMTVAKENSQIKLFKRDLMERPIVADIEPATDPLVAAAAEAVALNTPVTENKVVDFSNDDPNALPF